MSTEEMIAAIRKLVEECTAPEKEKYEALCDEAEGWQIRLEELEDDGDED